MRRTARTDRNRTRRPAAGTHMAEFLERRLLLTTAVTSGQGVTGDIQTATQHDQYTFAATAGGTVEVSAGPVGFDVGLAIGLDLYGPGGALVKTASASTVSIVTLSATAATSGTYTAVVRSANAVGGSYNFAAATVPATPVVDALGNGGGPVASGQGASGSIGGNLDVYSFAATAGGTVEVSAGPTGFDVGLEIGMDLLGPGGAVVQTVDAAAVDIVTLSATAPTTGTYYAVIRSANGVGGNYNFTAGVVPATPVANTLGNGGGPVASGQGASGNISGNLDVYSFAATAGGQIELSAGATGFDVGLHVGLDLFDPTGAMLKTVSETDESIVTLSTTAASTGTYYAVIRSANGVGGSYNFTAGVVPTTAIVNTLGNGGGPVASGQGRSGNISGNLDVYSFAATAGGQIELSAGATGFDVGLHLGLDLFDPTGAMLQTVSETNENIVTLSTTAASTGTYYAVIRSANGVGGSYNFTAGVVPTTAIVNTLGNGGGPVASGQGASGNISGNLDVYSFAAAAGGTIELSAGPTGFDVGLEIGMDLFDPTGAMLQTVNAATVSIVTLTTTAASTGTYYAVIRSANGVGGNYNFTAGVVPATPVANTLGSGGGPVVTGQGASGNISGNLDVYSFAAAAGGTVEVSAGPTGFDVGLQIGMDLFDPTGALLKTVSETNEDIVTLSAPATTTGTYYAVIRSANGVGGELQLHRRRPARHARGRRPGRRRRPGRERDGPVGQHQRQPGRLQLRGHGRPGRRAGRPADRVRRRPGRRRRPVRPRRRAPADGQRHHHGRRQGAGQHAFGRHVLRRRPLGQRRRRELHVHDLRRHAPRAAAGPGPARGRHVRRRRRGRRVDVLGRRRRPGAVPAQGRPGPVDRVHADRPGRVGRVQRRDRQLGPARPARGRPVHADRHHRRRPADQLRLRAGPDGRHPAGPERVRPGHVRRGRRRPPVRDPGHHGRPAVAHRVRPDGHRPHRAVRPVRHPAHAGHVRLLRHDDRRHTHAARPARGGRQLVRARLWRVGRGRRRVHGVRRRRRGDPLGRRPDGDRHVRRHAGRHHRGRVRGRHGRRPRRGPTGRRSARPCRSTPTRS